MNEPNYLHLTTLTAPKTSLNAQGGIVYALLKNEAASEIFFTLLQNQGGSGCFGREVIPFAHIEACLHGMDLTQPIPAKRFRTAFRQSKSVNNGGFLVACLRHQSLLKPAPDASHQHVIGEDWAAWKARMLEMQSDEIFIVPEADKPAKAEPGGGQAGDKKEKRSSAKGRKAAAPVSTEDGGNDHPA